ncbi:hypothetical protein [Paenibacillus plantiphilus]|uniref:hypothetical protein n=1 Tax=Paenibacillus plantiphilus TaxID=2905650 RepID=UPI001F1D9C47|nr:hypothetical protein [Paenibacillus plantiphilus]
MQSHLNADMVEWMNVAFQHYQTLRLKLTVLNLSTSASDEILQRQMQESFELSSEEARIH